MANTNVVVIRVDGVEKVLRGRAASAWQGAETRKITGQTPAQYAKEYDAFRNRARNYEKIAGLPRGSINVTKVLYTHAKGVAWAKREGKTYGGNLQYNAIALSPSASSGISTEKAIAAFNRAQKRMGGDIIDRATVDLMTKSKIARTVYENELAEIKGEPTYDQKLAALKKAKQALNDAYTVVTKRDGNGNVISSKRYVNLTGQRDFKEKYGFDPTEY